MVHRISCHEHGPERKAGRQAGRQRQTEERKVKTEIDWKEETKGTCRQTETERGEKRQEQIDWKEGRGELRRHRQRTKVQMVRVRDCREETEVEI